MTTQRTCNGGRRGYQEAILDDKRRVARSRDSSPRRHARSCDNSAQASCEKLRQFCPGVTRSRNGSAQACQITARRAGRLQLHKTTLSARRPRSARETLPVVWDDL